MTVTAMRVGAHAAIMGQPVTVCPFTAPGGDDAALRRVWLSAYLRVRPAEVADAEPSTAAGQRDGQEPDVDVREVSRG